jgi:hypothetical protein
MQSPAELVTAIIAARAKWLASIPAKVSATEGRDLADVALTDARTAVLAVVDQYHGTLPPPPWPMPPEMVRQRDRVRTVRDGYSAIARKEPPPVNFLPKVRANLVTEGGKLYDQAAELVKTVAKAPKLPDLLRLIPDPRKLIMGLPPALVVLGLWYVFGRKGSRLARF